MKKEVNEITTAKKILDIVYKALAKGQFNYHVTKVKGKTSEGSTEDVVETRLEAIDTKRLLEAVTALEKIVNIKKKNFDDEEPESQIKAEIVLPEVEYPENFGGDES